MSLEEIYTAGSLGIEGYIITVTASMEFGGPCLAINGQEGAALSETRSRVCASLARCGHKLAARKQIVSLTPSEQRRVSPGCDLAIACALLMGHGVITPDSLASTLLWGELAIDGTLRPAAGTLIVADTARQHGFRRIIVAEGSVKEAAMAPGLEVLGVRNLAQLIDSLASDELDTLVSSKHVTARITTQPTYGLDMSDIQGLALPRRAVEVMIAGGHNLLLYGPAGCGKTMLARRIPSLLPPLDYEEALETTKIHGVARRQIPDGLITEPPVRMPHHTVSVAGLVGGGNPPRPGEASLAHHGVLVLDELPEFSGLAFESLRGPLEDRTVAIVRARYALRYPASFQLMAAMNLCPCGFLGHPDRVCTDSPASIERYQGRADRLIRHFDLAVHAAPLLLGEPPEPPESSASVLERIIGARERQRERLEELPWGRNGEIPAGKPLERLCALDPDAEELFSGIRENTTDARAARILAVAQTIADLDLHNPRERITTDDLMEAANLWSPPEFVGEGL